MTTTPFQQHTAAELARRLPGLARLVDMTKLPAEPTVHGLPVPGAHRSGRWQAPGVSPGGLLGQPAAHGYITVTPAFANGDKGGS